MHQRPPDRNAHCKDHKTGVTVSPQQAQPMVSDQEWFDGAKEKLTWREIGPRTKRKHNSFGGRCSALKPDPTLSVLS